jgi:hypothetical protein
LFLGFRCARSQKGSREPTEETKKTTARDEPRAAAGDERSSSQRNERSSSQRNEKERQEKRHGQGVHHLEEEMEQVIEL